jgi:hypothetical protein
MSRHKYVVCIALFASACSTGLGDDADLGNVESEVGAQASKKPSKPPKDGGIDCPPPVDTPPPTDGGGGGGGDGGGGGGGGAAGVAFVDACLLPGATKVTFNATGSIDAPDEGVTSPINLPFSFTLSGATHSKFWITTNGQLGFGNTPGGSAFGQATCPLPDPRFTTPIVLVYSADLITRMDPGTGVCYATVGNAPDRKLVVTWKDSFFYEAWLTSHVTFSATLNEGTNVIDVVLDRVDAPSLPAFETGAAATLGRQAGGAGTVYSCYQSAPEGTIVHYNP